MEVEETPLCANCVVEMEIDEFGEEEVLRRGLRRIEKVDGGVTRQRYELKDEQRAVTPTYIKQGGDGAGSDGSDCRNSTGVQPPDRIWVNIFDPIDKPSFKPSPLKPIPWFMEQPKWVNVDTPQRPSSRNPNLQLPLPPRDIINRSSDSAPSTICPSGPRTPVPPRSSSRSPPKASAPDTSRSEILVNEILEMEELDYFADVGPLRPLVFRRKPTYINEEPLQRPSSRLTGSRRQSVTHASAYQTPPESYAEEEGNGGPETATIIPPPRKPSSPAASQLASQLHRLMKGGTPAQSTESVNSSRKSGTPSVAMSRAATEAKTDTSGSTTSLKSTSKPRSKEGSVRRGVGAELRRFFTGK